MASQAGSPGFLRLHFLCFWWILFLLLQQGQRGILLAEAWSRESPSVSILRTTLLTGFQADLIVATVATTAVMLLASMYVRVIQVFSSRPRASQPEADIRSGYTKAGVTVGLLVTGLLMIDLGYYHYAQTHLDFVFFEYLEDVFSPRERSATLPTEGPALSQALKQTQAEISQIDKWATLVAVFSGLEALLAWSWLMFYRRFLAPSLVSWQRRSPRAARFALIGCLVLGLSGLNAFGPWGVQRTNISSSVYYTLAQNPIWYAAEAWVGTSLFTLAGGTTALESMMPFHEALERSRAMIDPQGTFPFPAYPFVREVPVTGAVRFPQPVNILLIFVEGLDRRYLGRVIDTRDPKTLKTPFIYWTPQQVSREADVLSNRSTHQIRVTPFLDRLRHDSLYFAHFFSNGDQTARALFATLCSYWPRRGAAVMKTRYTQDFLCLPRVLREAGYWTEMIVGQNRDRNYDHLGLFLANQGLHQLLDENAFPPDAERIGLGISDEALFEFVADRVRRLRTQSRPYFLTTLTVGTHHPYSYPIRHPDVQALHVHEDQYVPALRVLDLALERFFSTMQRDGLFERTLVLILGDHGRHEGIGGSDPAARGGHFLVPLYIWIDPSLEDAVPARSKLVTTIASQVDLAPTILAMIDAMPPLAPFLGRDLSCAFLDACAHTHVAYVSGAHDDVIGIVDSQAMWLYAFRRQTLFRTSLDGHHPEGDTLLHRDAMEALSHDAPFRQRYRDMLAFYVSTNFTLAERRVWPGRDWRRLTDRSALSASQP